MQVQEEKNEQELGISFTRMGSCPEELLSRDSGDVSVTSRYVGAVVLRAQPRPEGAHPRKPVRHADPTPQPRPIYSDPLSGPPRRCFQELPGEEGAAKAPEA